MDRGGEWEGGRRRGTLIARAPEMTSPVRRTLSSVTSALAVRNLWMYLERKDCRAGTVADAVFTAFYSWPVNGAVAFAGMGSPWERWQSAGRENGGRLIGRTGGSGQQRSEKGSGRGERTRGRKIELLKWRERAGISSERCDDNQEGGGKTEVLLREPP